MEHMKMIAIQRYCVKNNIYNNSFDNPELGNVSKRRVEDYQENSLKKLKKAYETLQGHGYDWDENPEQLPVHENLKELLDVEKPLPVDNNPLLRWGDWVHE